MIRSSHICPWKTGKVCLPRRVLREHWLDLWQICLYASSNARGNSLVCWDGNAVVVELLCHPSRLRKFSLLAWLIFKLHHLSVLYLSLGYQVSYPRSEQALGCFFAEKSIFNLLSLSLYPAKNAGFLLVIINSERLEAPFSLAVSRDPHWNSNPCFFWVWQNPSPEEFNC